MRILKFGGKSLSTKEKVQNVCEYVKKIYQKDKQIILVVSAMGNRTNELIEKSKLFSGNNTPSRELDVLLSIGETETSALVAMMLNSMNVPAKSFQGFQIQLETFGAFGNSKVAYINKKALLDAMQEGFVSIVAGFQGINRNGEITTLGRGGSDTTATAIASVFEQPVEIYSDFDGVFCGDPRVLNFKKIKKINYDTMKQMSESGAKVLDSRAVSIAKQFNINILSKSSSDFNKNGTIVSNIENDVVAISNIDNLCKITITFSNKSKFKFIAQNVINEIKEINFYNLTCENNIISFYISSSLKNDLMLLLSKKFNLLKK